MRKPKQRVKGERYRPVVEVLKVKGDKPSILRINGERYVLDRTNMLNTNKK